MSREFKSSSTIFNTHIGVAIFMGVITIGFYLFLNVAVTMYIFFAVFWAVMAFWYKDRVLITLHEDYLEAKEAIAAKKKLIRYSDITDVELHKKGRRVTLYVKSNGTNKKVHIGLNPIEKKERVELVDSLKSIIDNEKAGNN